MAVKKKTGSVTYQVDESPHSIFMCADALTGVKASLCHCSPDCVLLRMRQNDYMQPGNTQTGERMLPLVSTVLNCCFIGTPRTKGGDYSVKDSQHFYPGLAISTLH